MDISEQDKQRIEKEATKDFRVNPTQSFILGAYYEHTHLSDLLSSQSKEIERLKENIKLLKELHNEIRKMNNI